MDTKKGESARGGLLRGGMAAIKPAFYKCTIQDWNKVYDCSICKKKFTFAESLGKMECARHQYHCTFGRYSCCGQPYNSKGCVKTDHKVEIRRDKFYLLGSTESYRPSDKIHVAAEEFVCAHTGERFRIIATDEQYNEDEALRMVEEYLVYIKKRYTESTLRQKITSLIEFSNTSVHQ